MARYLGPRSSHSGVYDSRMRLVSIAVLAAAACRSDPVAPPVVVAVPPPSAEPAASASAAPSAAPSPLGAAEADAGTTNTSHTIRALRPRFRACYQAGSKSKPALSGSVVISARVAPNGEVTAADVTESAGLDPATIACLTRSVKDAQFDATSDGKPTTVKIPIRFVAEGDPRPPTVGRLTPD